jgi:hypothetical protein
VTDENNFVIQEIPSGISRGGVYLRGCLEDAPLYRCPHFFEATDFVTRDIDCNITHIFHYGKVQKLRVYERESDKEKGLDMIPREYHPEVSRMQKVSPKNRWLLRKRIWNVR